MPEAVGMEPPDNQRESRAVQLVAIAACCLGLSTACGFVPARPSRPIPLPPPLPALAANADLLTFPTTKLGARSEPRTLMVVSPGDSEAPQFEARLAPGSQFAAGMSCSSPTPRGTCMVAIVFAPRQAGVAEEQIELRPFDGRESLWVRLRGEGVAPVEKQIAPR